MQIDNHMIFGKKEENVSYRDRHGAYLIAIQNGGVALIRTPKGLFLPGGGKEANETDAETIVRECLEETGCIAVVEQLVCTAETYMVHPEIGYFHPVQHYYVGQLSNPIQEPQNSDHCLEWGILELTKGNLFVSMQNWALDVALQSEIC